ncbi:RmlC-like cupin domain-containing protein [Colletotrichum phormii]|uniref:RmlC-like cupin domain-containing protein n=1 Tax=Colletotrichum phormii TaxID=359342 RepID=A0AAI9ZT05_9PEZI|nr:RmlC-like cupin domain-containing protein [Colletotrichum phormii]KAK1637654.1 RmlC-like cupin domain-containing protein [Colletotrichum phormii]
MRIANVPFAVMALSSLAMAAPHRRDNESATGLSLTAQLQIADSGAARYRLLPKDEDFIYDFNKSQVALANRQTFPAVTGLGGSMAVASLPACAMSFLHLHPRASELLVVTSGRVITEMVPEAGVLDADGKQRVIRADLGPNQMTVFPQGSFHTQVNPECTPASAVVSFTSDEGGTAMVAAQLFALSDDVIETSFGSSIAGEDIDRVRQAIPKNLVLKVEECLKKCGLEKRAV